MAEPAKSSGFDWGSMGASIAQGAMRGLTGTPGAGPSSAFGESSARLDASGWSVNQHGVQGTAGSGAGGAGGISPVMLMLFAVGGFVLWRKLRK